MSSTLNKFVKSKPYLVSLPFPSHGTCGRRSQQNCQKSIIKRQVALWCVTSQATILELLNIIHTSEFVFGRLFTALLNSSVLAYQSQSAAQCQWYIGCCRNDPDIQPCLLQGKEERVPLGTCTSKCPQAWARCCVTWEVRLWDVPAVPPEAAAVVQQAFLFGCWWSQSKPMGSLAQCDAVCKNNGEANSDTCYFLHIGAVSVEKVEQIQFQYLVLMAAQKIYEDLECLGELGSALGHLELELSLMDPV